MIIKNLDIRDFRGFSRFRLCNLGRVNLLVGTNNCGKTTILEAVSILLANGNFSPIRAALASRGEEILGSRETAAVRSSREADIRRLFRGHEASVGKEFELSSVTDQGDMAMIARIYETRPEEQRQFESEPYSVDSSEELLPPLRLSLDWSGVAIKNLSLPISRRGGISYEILQRFAFRRANADAVPVRFITAASLSAEAVSYMFEEIVLMPEEDLVIDAMRIIEPQIERIASSGTEGVRSSIRYSPRGGILVRLKGVGDRIPIGSMGDGMWRILGLALAVVQSSGGILLVDEIDTGLHHTVMEKMWRFLYEAAKRYSVQVIATTHSWDCYHSLAVICRDEVSEGSDVTISRIESGREEAVSYTEQEIKAAAEFDIEVR
ncbi:MAG: AAA family ATPase [Isosphaeraceae bacterium]